MAASFLPQSQHVDSSPMTYADRWLLPDGVEEILPAVAKPLEDLRRRLLDLYATWGYELVIPPMLEYTDSLLIGLGRDLDLLTFKVTDQLTGRALGIRADFTPQIARIDAHSMNKQGANRLCYAGNVVYTKPKSALATRTPFQVGLEFFGEASVSADIEVVSLLLESLRVAGLPRLHIDLGHVGIYRSLAAQAGLSSQEEQELFDLLQRKAATEISLWVAQHVKDKSFAQLFLVLPNLSGGVEILKEAKKYFAAVPAALEAVNELQQVAEAIAQRYPEAELYFDLSELRGYHYLTGLVFAAFAPGFGNPIASGGRYDHIGEVFGRSRAATGFGMSICALSRIVSSKEKAVRKIAVIDDGQLAQWNYVNELRTNGDVVVYVTSESESKDFAHQLKMMNGEYKIISV